MEKVCPNCHKKYETVLDRLTDMPIQLEFPDAQPWEREQCISGICSDKCWAEFLGLEEISESELPKTKFPRIKPNKEIK